MIGVSANQCPLSWAHVDLNHGPHPYQGCALTGLSYGPQLVVKDEGFYRSHHPLGKSRIRPAAPDSDSELSSRKAQRTSLVF